MEGYNANYQTDCKIKSIQLPSKIKEIQRKKESKESKERSEKFMEQRKKEQEELQNYVFKDIE
jgi:hypothetical protein